MSAPQAEMGEEAVKMQEEEGAKVQEMKEEAKMEEPKPSAASPFVLFVDLHCTGCAKKIEKSVMRIRGVEGVSIDMGKNEVSIKGIVEPEAVCAKITKKTKRVAKVLSPLPPAEGEPIPQLVNSQVGGLTVVELNVNMHCEACAQQLKKKILKMRGVQTASTELSTGKVVVSGTMDGNKLVEYVYRRTKKQARIVPQPEPTPEPEPEPEPQPQPQPQPAEEAEAAKKGEEEIKKEEASSSSSSAAAAAAAETKTEEAAAAEATRDTNKVVEEKEEPKAGATTTVEEEVEQGSGDQNHIIMDHKTMMLMGSGMEDHENIKRMMMYQHYQYHPLYVIERIPPPQLFSDENPNACSIL